MKIDKIVFSSSEEYSDFWNLQSFIWNKFLGIEPVCLLWGKVKNTNMHDRYGQIIEKEYNEDLVKSFQLTWSKFHHTSTEPETTWIIGDMDLVPLQTKWFRKEIESVDEDSYTHLASAEHERRMISRRPEMINEILNPDAEEHWIRPEFYMQLYAENRVGLGAYGGFLAGPGGADLPAYYHAAKGKTFIKALDLDKGSFEDQVREVIQSNKFGYGPQHTLTKAEAQKHLSHIPIDKQELYYWLADENYTSHKIYNAIKEKKIRYEIANVPSGTPIDRLDRSDWTGEAYTWGLERVLQGRWSAHPSFLEFLHNFPPGLREIGPGMTMDAFLKRRYFIDIHCHRPYKEQKDSLQQIVMTSFGA
jgi:hypothetical protein